MYTSHGHSYTDMMFRPDLWNRSVKLALAVTLCFAVLLWIRPPQREDATRLKTWVAETAHYGKTRPLHNGDNIMGECPEGKGIDNIVVTVKTGASEAANRIPIQLATSLRCPPNLLHFSDMEQDLSNHSIHDSLVSIPNSLKDGNPDFDIYRKQQARKKQGWHEEAVTVQTQEAAWNLDKYKNLHIVKQAWSMLPGKDWYLHIDADTYLVWPSLVWWLRTLDSSKPLYTGSLTCFGSVKAAHGGSGILISEAATRLVVENASTIPAWDGEARGRCCGDELVANAMLDNGVQMHNSWPMINGDTVWSIPFSADYWCEPVVTMHHMSTADMEKVAAFEKSRPKHNDPLTYQELFNRFVIHAIPEVPQDDWDNMSEGIVVPDCPALDQCIQLCEENAGCFQANFDGSTCNLGTKNFRLGEEKKAEGRKKWQSVWMKARMQKWASKHKDCSGWQPAFKDNFVCG